MNSFERNSITAYQGESGQRRLEFCVSYIKHKQTYFRQIKQDVCKQVESQGETITCHQGCSACCVLYVEANIQECEAIVYYLYQHPGTLSLFLIQYQEWSDVMRRRGNPDRICEKAINDSREKKRTADRESLLDALLLFHEQNLPCPFLHDGACMIYEVRPYACANHYATTPAGSCSIPSWVNPLNPHKPAIYHADTLGEVQDLSFYYQPISKPVIKFMASTVYEILKYGFTYLAAVTGIKGLL